MTELLIKLLIKNNKDTNNSNVRTAYGIMASVVGILCNILLFVIKIFIGLLVNSIAVLADAFNNLSDAASSIISFIGIRMAGKPADKEHPFGHGRIEYLSAFIIAFIIMEVGFSVLKGALAKIRNPEVLYFNFISILFLILSIGIKIWLAVFNRKIANRIDSKVMKATATDCMGDVFTTSVTIISILIYHFAGVNLDGYMGILVALVVMYAGFTIARETIEPLIGEAVDQELYLQIKNFVESYDGICGTHDLIVHNYGPSKSMATIHAEVPNNEDVEKSHEIIDRIEHDVLRQLGIFLVIHMDPIETENEIILNMKGKLQALIGELDKKVSMHDFRMVEGENHSNLIFDLVVPHHYNKEMRDYLKNTIIDRIKEADQRYECIITVEESYLAKQDDL